MNKRILLSLAIVSTACSQLGAAIDATDLLNNSPFVRAKAPQGQAGGATGSQYVFRGICVIGGETMVNISDEAAKKTYWIKTNETAGDIKVVSYDEKDKKVSLLVGSRDYTLEMIKAKTQDTTVKAAQPIQKPNENKPRDTRRIRRIRQSGSIPPPPDINDPNLPPELRGPNGPWGAHGRNARTGAAAQGNDSSANPSDKANSLTDTTNNSNSEPPTNVPPPPPSFVPELPESILNQINNGTPPSN